MAEENPNQAGVTDPDAGGEAAETGEGGEPITREAFIAMRQDMQNKIETLSDQNTLYKTRLELLERGHGGGGQPAPANEPDIFEDREDDDVPTVGDLRRFDQRIKGMFQQISTNLGASLGELRMTARQGSDYEEVVKNHLPIYLQSHPEMVEVLRALPPHLRPNLAYELGSLDPAYLAKKNQARLDKGAHGDVGRIEANKGKPHLGGKGGGAPLSKASLYESMSDAELEKTIAQVKSGRLHG
jgi:hypothetical protein